MRNSKPSTKAALLGLGSVGLNLLKQNSELTRAFQFYWLADSKHIISKNALKPFTSHEIRRILALKSDTKSKFADGCEARVANCVAHDHSNLSDEIKTIRELTRDPLQDWVIFDTTSSRAETSHRIVDTLLGCKAYCTANKTSWANFDFCSVLYNKAENQGTLLGLNCTTGVWVDQMEILPLVMSAFRRGKVRVWKRDNSSFNLFFDRLARLKSAEEVIRDVEASGHLEPGKGGLLAEVRDQTLKGRIASNVCGLILGKEPSFEVETEKNGESMPPSMDPFDVAEWHRAGRQRGEYPAIITRISVSDECIQGKIDFENLPKEHKLARDFPGKSAIYLNATKGSSFRWSSGHPRSTRAGYMHSGYGGAVRTATKLIWEARRAVSLLRDRDTAEFSPIPVIYGLRLGESSPSSLELKLARNL